MSARLLVAGLLFAMPMFSSAMAASQSPTPAADTATLLQRNATAKEANALIGIFRGRVPSAQGRRP